MAMILNQKPTNDNEELVRWLLFVDDKKTINEELFTRMILTLDAANPHTNKIELDADSFRLIVALAFFGCNFDKTHRS